jgi:hypothetical protein
MSDHDLPNLELTGFRHPVSQQVMIMPEEEAKAFVKFTDAYIDHFKVSGPVEQQLAFSLAESQWRLNSIRAVQNNMLSLELAKCATIAIDESNAQTAVVAAQRQPKKAMTLRELSMYEQRLNRQFHQDLKTLRSLQEERYSKESQNLEEAAQLLNLEKSKAPKGEPCTYNPIDDGYPHPLERVEKHLDLRDRRREALLFEKAILKAAA